MQVQKIAIGVCTYKRPALLGKCLQSLRELMRPAVPVCIIIADNDPAGSGGPVVEDFVRDADLYVQYCVEPQRGIPFARNAVLREALRLNITELAFIDDDEYADSMWLVSLWDYYRRSGADVVRGHVETVYPPETPDWIVAGKFHQRSRHGTGTVFTWAATNNVLFNFQKIAIEQGCRFDQAFGLSGGSDEDFFRRAHMHGAVIRYVENAIVYEPLQPERMSVAYYLKRKWRVKNTLHVSGPVRVRFISLREEFRSLLRALLFLMGSPHAGRHVIVKRLGDVVVPLARIAALLGIHIAWKEYK